MRGTNHRTRNMTTPANPEVSKMAAVGGVQNDSASVAIRATKKTCGALRSMKLVGRVLMRNV
jgi:hypothetical protein